MANYTAADVKRLRELTGSGMMDCKKALEGSDGDLEKAVELLRIKGAKDVGKRAERATSAGLVAGESGLTGGVLVELLCETDFVAKSDDFVGLANKVLRAAVAAGPSDVEELRSTSLEGGTVDDAVQALSARIGEKLQVSRYVRLDSPVALYLHRRATDLPPAIGVLVSYTVGAADGGASGGAAEDAAAETARGVAMHIAASRPRYVTRAEIPAELVANERRIAEATAREEGKPEQALPRIVEGRVNGFYKDVVLLEQASVHDTKKTVKAMLAEAGVTVSRFARFEVGQA